MSRDAVYLGHILDAIARIKTGGQRSLSGARPRRVHLRWLASNLAHADEIVAVCPVVALIRATFRRHAVAVGAVFRSAFVTRGDLEQDLGANVLTGDAHQALAVAPSRTAGVSPVDAPVLAGTDVVPVPASASSGRGVLDGASAPPAVTAAAPATRPRRASRRVMPLPKSRATESNLNVSMSAVSCRCWATSSRRPGMFRGCLYCSRSTCG